VNQAFCSRVAALRYEAGTLLLECARIGSHLIDSSVTRTRRRKRNPDQSSVSFPANG